MVFVYGYLKLDVELIQQGRHIVATLLANGRASFAGIRLGFGAATDADDDALEDAFNLLVEQTFVVPVADNDALSVADLKQALELQHLTNNPNLSAAEKAKFKKSVASRAKDALAFDDLPLAIGNKPNLIYAFDPADDNKAAKINRLSTAGGGFVSEYLNDVANLPENAFWRINPSRFHLHSRNLCLTELAGARINSSAKEIMQVILEFAEPEMKHCKADDFSSPITLTHLASRIDMSRISYNPSTSRSSLTDYMALLTQDQEFPLLIKQDERGGGQYVANLRGVTTSMQEQLVVNFVKERHGIVAARIWRLLHAKGMLGEKEVAQLALISNKVARETLYMLMQSGMIFLQDVPKSNEYIPSRTAYL
ncbi:DNA-directed RNA polymerase III subunit RPC3 [Physocladia obscura]|uniref:DNA-directed RNA polymerase III subunit RPC3 n=1 Tax=Physocladia obscura TaxID=109957 RepID=A0AAD5XIU3_9FUNG|nr:DNA-directed RNA polymerase III subunit RPC3 [Physocladia obscura]